MTTLQYESYLKMLGSMLTSQNIVGEILLAPNITLLLDIHQQEVTKDITAYFGPGKTLRAIADLIAHNENLSTQWLDQAIVDTIPHRTLLSSAIYPGLHIYVAPPAYLLTMLLLFGDQHDDETIKRVAKQLEFSTITEAFSLVITYIPEQLLPSYLQAKIAHTFAA